MEMPDLKTALQANINDQVAQAKQALGLPTTVPFSRELSDNPEELMNTLLKQQKVPRRARRAFLAQRRKPGKAARK